MFIFSTMKTCHKYLALLTPWQFQQISFIYILQIGLTCASLGKGKRWAAGANCSKEQENKSKTDIFSSPVDDNWELLLSNWANITENRWSSVSWFCGLEKHLKKEAKTDYWLPWIISKMRGGIETWTKTKIQDVGRCKEDKKSQQGSRHFSWQWK